MTDRDPVGSTIEGPMYRASGDRRPEYLLALREVQVGDIVFHLDLKQKAIVACSAVEDPLVEDLIEEDVLDGEPWWTIHLTGTAEIEVPVTLDKLRRDESKVAAAIGGLPQTARAGNPRHLVFENHGHLPLHQGAYLTKLPRAIVQLYKPLAQAAAAHH